MHLYKDSEGKLVILTHRLDLRIKGKLLKYIGCSDEIILHLPEMMLNNKNTKFNISIDKK